MSPKCLFLFIRVTNIISYYIYFTIVVKYALRVSPAETMVDGLPPVSIVLVMQLKPLSLRVGLTFRRFEAAGRPAQGAYVA